MMRLVTRSVLTLAALVPTSGCMWVTGTVIVLLGLEDNGGGGSSLTLPEVDVVLLSRDEAAKVMEDATTIPDGESWREGVVPFRVTLRGPASGGEHRLRFFYLDADLGEHDVTSIDQRSSDGQVEMPPEWTVPPDLLQQSRIVLWNTEAEGIGSGRYSLIARWRGAQGVSESFDVDNTPIPSFRIPEGFVPEPRYSGEEPFENVYEIPVLVEGEERETVDEDDLATVPVTVQARIVKEDGTLVEIAGLRVEASDGGLSLFWHSEREFPDHHVRVRFEARPRQLKYGDWVSTPEFRIDNRKPRPSSTSPQFRLRGDENFTLTVFGDQFAWEGSGMALAPPGIDDPVDDLFFALDSPTAPPGEDSPAFLDGPGRLEVQVDLEDVRAAHLRDHRGEIILWVRNPNGRRVALESPLFVAPSEVSYVGPFYSLPDEPTDVAVGDFVRDRAGASGTAHLDVAVISRVEEPPTVTILVGDGAGNLPNRRTVPLSETDVSALALERVRPEGDRYDGLLVATSRTLELVRYDAARDDFRVARIADLAEEVAGRRALAIADFDGGGPVAVVSSSSRVEFLRLDWRGESASREGEIEGRGLPRALAVADFDCDFGEDLVLLSEVRGTPTFLLYLSGRNGFFDGAWSPRPAAPGLELTDAGHLMVASEETGFDGDGCADLLVPLRNDDVSKILVHREGESFRMSRHPRSVSLSGPARDVALLHLPGGARRPTGEDIVDFATVDTGSGALTVAYASEDGLNDENPVTYPLPGQGEALAAGDLDGNGQQDIVVVTSEPATVTVLLSHPDDGTSVDDDPLFYPHGSPVGEVPLRTPGALGVSFGYAGVGQTEPFLATVSRVSNELTVIYLLDEAPWFRFERHREVEKGARSLVVADFDGRNGDDIAIAATDDCTLFLLRNRGSGFSPRFEKEETPLLEIAPDSDPRIPPDLVCDGGLETGFRVMAHADVDGDQLPDLIVPITREEDEEHCYYRDYVAVITNPGQPGRSELNFYCTLNDPRTVRVAEVNGDGTVDLLVACEGKERSADALCDSVPAPECGFEPEVGNSIHILLGNPWDPGTFVDRKERLPPGFENFYSLLHPVRLPGSELEDGEVEVIATDSAPDGVAPASWIVASGDQEVFAYHVERNGTFRGPMVLYPDGGDPEDLVLHDFFGEDGLLDAAILDEGSGEIIFLRNEGPQPDGNAPWVDAGVSLKVGSPQGLALFETEGRLTLAVASRQQHEIVLYEQAAPGGEDFEAVRSIPLTEPDLSGRRTGLSGSRNSDGSSLVASLVEDGCGRLGSVAVDLLRQSGEERQTRRLCLPDACGSAPSGESGLVVLLGHFSGGDDDLDLLVLGGEGQATCFPSAWGGPNGDEKEYPECSPEPAASYSLDLGFVDPIVDAHVLETPSMTLLAVATSREVGLVEVDPIGSTARSVWRWSRPEDTARIRRIAPGWLRADADRSPRDDLYVAILEDKRLSVIAAGEADEVVLHETPGRLGAVGARDVDGDDREDIVVIDGIESSLTVFLARRSRPEASSLFGPGESIEFPQESQPIDLDFLDANKDTLVDVCFGVKSGEVFIFLGNGDGSFADQQEHFAGPGLEGLLTLDTDGNGSKEIVVSVAVPGLVVLKNGESTHGGEDSR